MEVIKQVEAPEQITSVALEATESPETAEARETTEVAKATEVSDSNFSSSKKDEQSSTTEYMSVDSSSYCDASSGYGTVRTTNPGPFHHREMKKERVKQCLRELKSLMPPSREKKGGLLKTLQQVVQRMKEIKEEEKTGDDGCKAGESGPIGIDLMSDTGKGDFSEKSYTIVMSLEENVVLQVIESLTDMLGYPKNYWVNQSLMDYIRRKDIATLSNSLAEVYMRAASTSVPKEEAAKNVFFFALRHYKSLRQGFNLLRSEKFTTFRAKANVVAAPCPGTSSDAVAEKNYLVLDCTPVYSAYTESNKLPAECSFVTKHTVFCNYCAVQHQAIPLLGYLPQDMIGTSIFKYYHPDDLPMLYNIYQQVVSQPGKKLKSTPYRMRCQNGDFLYVETEWSSYVNPWTKKLDFIIGHHEVVVGPTNLDVFADCQPKQDWESTGVHLKYEDITAIENNIKSLLLQVGDVKLVKEKAKLEADPTAPNETTEAIANEEKEEMKWESSSPRKMGMLGTFMDEAVSSTLKSVKLALKRKEEEPNSPSQSSNLSLCNEDLSVLYQGVNYAGNIRRFLLSCPAVISYDNHDTQYQIKQWDDDTIASISEEDHNIMDVDLPLPRPPSSASTTKALVSEQEHREELMPPSPAHNEDIGEEAQEESTSEEDYTPVALTENILKMHDKIQEQVYLEELIKEKSGYLLSMQSVCKRRVVLASRALQKRHAEQAEEPIAPKMLVMDDRQGLPQMIQSNHNQQMLLPPFPITSIDTHRTTTSPTSSFQHSRHDSSQAIPIAIPSSASGLPPKFVTISAGASNSTGQSCHLQTTGSHSSTKPVCSPCHSSLSPPLGREDTVGGFQWAICPQTGMPMLQPFTFPPFCMPMTPYYSPFGGPPTLATQQGYPASRSVTSSLSQSGIKKARYISASSKGQDTDRDEASMEETGSSLFYLLESTTSNHQSDDACGGAVATSSLDRTVLKPLQTDPVIGSPHWRQMVNWNKDLCLNYVAPQHDRKNVLKNDQQILRKLKQPRRVIHQLEELLVMQSSSETETGDESDLWLPAKQKFSHMGITGSLSDSDDKEKEALAEHGYRMSDNQPDKIMDQSVLLEHPESKSCEDKTQSGGQTKLETSGCDKCNSESSQSDSFEMLSEGCGSRGSVGSSTEAGEAMRSKSELANDKTGENESDNNSETGSGNDSSDLTPSDQRSHEDAGSSVKESDNASSHSSGSSNKEKGNHSLGSESEHKCTKLLPNKNPGDEIFGQLFSPMQMKCETSNKSAPWLMDANFGELVQLNYQHVMLDKDNTLQRDKIQLLRMAQSDMVLEQMFTLFKGPNTEDPSGISGSSAESSAENNVDMKVPLMGTLQAERDSPSDDSGSQPKSPSFTHTPKKVSKVKEALNDLYRPSIMGPPPIGGGYTDSSMGSFRYLKRGDAVYSYDSRSALSSSATQGYKNASSSSSEKVGVPPFYSSHDKNGSLRSSDNNHSDSSAERFSSVNTSTLCIPISRENTERPDCASVTMSYSTSTAVTPCLYTTSVAGGKEDLQSVANPVRPSAAQAAETSTQEQNAFYQFFWPEDQDLDRDMEFLLSP